MPSQNAGPVLGSGLVEILSRFTTDDDEHLDLASCSLVEFPKEIFDLDLSRVVNLDLDHNMIYDLPLEISFLVNLKYLSLVGNNLRDLPDSLCSLECLEELSLNENELSVLPCLFGSLKQLRVLSLIGNCLAYLPASFKELACLEELYIDENELESLPDGLGLLASIKIIEASSNHLTFLPDDLGQSSRLQVLSVGSNSLVELPLDFCKLSTLKLLDVSHNKLTSLPDTFGSATVIQKLFVEDNDLKNVPSWFGSMAAIVELSISDNYIANEAFSDDFCRASCNVRKIDAGGNFMMSLSSSIGLLSKLEHLHIGSTIGELERSNFQNGNWIKDLPDSLCCLSQLRKLNINENQIEKLPEDFGCLWSLQWLDAGQNLLEVLPDSFCDLCNLEYLQLSKNLLKALPARFGNLKNLLELRVDSNLLTSVPESLGEIAGLQALDLFDNKLSQIPQVIFKFKHLKRLDLDQNSFPVKLEEVPKVTPTNQYPPRDPSLKDNWRGRSRPDKQKVEIVLFQADSGLADSQTAEEIQFNQNALQDAMRRGMSFWRSHASTLTSREIMNRVSEKLAAKPDDDDEWVGLAYSNSCSKRNLSNRHEPFNPDEEDWDREIEEYEQYSQVVKACQQQKGSSTCSAANFSIMMNSYPPACQAYSHTANYESFLHFKVPPQHGLIQTRRDDRLFKKAPFHCRSADGQFEDA